MDICRSEKKIITRMQNKLPNFPAILNMTSEVTSFVKKTNSLSFLSQLYQIDIWYDGNRELIQRHFGKKKISCNEGWPLSCVSTFEIGLSYHCEWLKGLNPFEKENSENIPAITFSCNIEFILFPLKDVPIPSCCVTCRRPSIRNINFSTTLPTF